MSYSLIGKKGEYCQNCTLKDRPFAPTEVPLTEGKTVWFIGEAPGFYEPFYNNGDNLPKGRPFVGRAGKLMRQVLDNIRFFEELKGRVVITNTCLCNPLNNKPPTQQEKENCKWHFRELLEKYPPVLCILLGRTAVSNFLEIGSTLENLRGKEFEHLEFGKLVVTYHPSAVLRSKEKYGSKFEMDMSQFLIKGRKLLGYESDNRMNIEVCYATEEIIKKIKELKGEQKEIALSIETSINIGKEREQWVIDGLNPYGGSILSIALSSGNKTIAFPFLSSDTLEKIYRKEKELYFDIFGTDNISDDEFAVNKPLRGKIPKLLPNQLHILKDFIEKVKNIDARAIISEIKEIKNLITYDAKFKMRFFQANGIDIKFNSDIQVISYLLNENLGSYSLNNLKKIYLGDSSEGITNSIFERNGRNAFYISRIYEKIIASVPPDYISSFKKANKFIMSITVPLITDIEMNGVKITDWEQYNDYRDLLGKIKDYNLLRIKNTCGIANPNSDSFKEKIYELYEYEPEITKTGELSLTEKMLENIIRRTGDLIVKELAISKMTILKIDRILNEGKRLYENLNEKTGRVHPIYNIIGTKTGRVVASNPPIQHISKESIFKFCPECNSALLDDSDKCCLCNNEYELNEFNWISAESGCSVIEADYSQMEIRILAELSKEMSLINIINQDIDIYKYIAGIFFNKKYNDVDEDMRNIAKQILISFVYGSTPIGVAQSLNIDVKRVETLFKKVKELFPRIEGYVYRVHKKAEIEKYVETPFGRRRRFNDIGFNELRQAQNFPIQSFAFDIVTYVAYNISNELKRNNCGRVIKLTPDSIIVEYPNQDYNLVKKILHYYMVIWAKKHFNLSVNLSIKYKDIYVENENKNLLKYGRLSI